MIDMEHYFERIASHHNNLIINNQRVLAQLKT